MSVFLDYELHTMKTITHLGDRAFCELSEQDYIEVDAKLEELRNYLWTIPRWNEQRISEFKRIELVSKAIFDKRIPSVDGLAGMFKRIHM